MSRAVHMVMKTTKVCLKLAMNGIPAANKAAMMVLKSWKNTTHLLCASEIVFS